MDLILAISATATQANTNFLQIKETLKSIIDRYGSFNIRYGVIVFGNIPSVQVPLAKAFNTDQLRKDYIDSQLARTSGSDLGRALGQAKTMFDTSEQERPGAKKVLGRLLLLFFFAYFIIFYLLNIL